jgi:hypothetical protein
MNTTENHDIWEMARFLARAFLLLALALLLFFWLSVLESLIGSLIRGGWRESSSWILHIAGHPWDPIGLNQTPPRWGLVAERFTVAILLSVVVWIANRKTIRHAIASWRRNA